MHVTSGRGEVGGGARDTGVRSGGRKWDIEPVLDRLVLFRSDLVDHEVSHLTYVWCFVFHFCVSFDFKKPKTNKQKREFFFSLIFANLKTRAKKGIVTVIKQTRYLSIRRVQTKQYFLH